MKPSDKVAAKLLKDMAKEFQAACSSDIEGRNAIWIEVFRQDAEKLLARYERWKKSVRLP